MVSRVSVGGARRSGDGLRMVIRVKTVEITAASSDNGGG